MTKQGFKNYQRGIALQVVLADKGKISQTDMSKALKIIVGKDIFEEVEQGLDDD
ncbi:MAG: hypothetical protein FWH20_05010 [Oscillospiraceae bacterium]|nr:hypothetical protein [Oscillospiraceae bacterium]